MSASRDPLGQLQQSLAAAVEAAGSAAHGALLPDVPVDLVRRQIAHARSLLHRAERHLDNYIREETA